jgi:hypothetical protein
MGRVVGLCTYDEGELIHKIQSQMSVVDKSRSSSPSLLIIQRAQHVQTERSELKHVVSIGDETRSGYRTVSHSVLRSKTVPLGRLLWLEALRSCMNEEVMWTKRHVDEEAVWTKRLLRCCCC